MKILIVAATPFECYDFQKYYDDHRIYFEEKNIQLDFLITGVGMVPTTFALSQYLNGQEVDMAIQMGVAGSFRQGIGIGDIVQVASEAFGDMGAEDGAERLDLFEMNLWEAQRFPFDNKLLFASEKLPIAIGKDLKKVHSITVNLVSGVAETIQYRRKKFAADIESMEGAAFHYVCLQMNVPFIQIRSISNYVEPRNTSNWKMKDAIDKLNRYLIEALG